MSFVHLLDVSVYEVFQTIGVFLKEHCNRSVKPRIIIFQTVYQRYLQKSISGRSRFPSDFASNVYKTLVDSTSNTSIQFICITSPESQSCGMYMTITRNIGDRLQRPSGPWRQYPIVRSTKTDQTIGIVRIQDHGRLPFDFSSSQLSKSQAIRLTSSFERVIPCHFRCRKLVRVAGRRLCLWHRLLHLLRKIR